jgi:hypothetical protein
MGRVEGQGDFKSAVGKNLNNVECLRYSQPSVGIIRTTAGYFLEGRADSDIILQNEFLGRCLACLLDTLVGCSAGL